MNDAKLLIAFSKRCIGLSDGDKLAIASGMPRLFRPVLPRLSTDQGSGPRSGDRKAIVARLPRPSADCAEPRRRRCR